MKQEVWSAVIMRPYDVRDVLDQDVHIRQCRVLSRASSRVAFARKLIAAGLDHRSPAAVSSSLRDEASPTRNARDLEAVCDERVYLTALNGGSARYVPYPIEAAS